MNGFIKSMKVVSAAIICGVTIFGIVVYFILKPTNDPPTPKYLIFVLPLIIALGLLFGEVTPTRKFQAVRGKDLKTKTAAYQSAVIIRSMALEAPALIAIITALILQNRYWLWFAIFPIFWLIYRFPTENDVIKSLDLNYEDIQKLENS